MVSLHALELKVDDNITIIEGPPPTFEAIREEWALGLAECPDLSHVVSTRLRTFNGPALVERCHHAFRKQQPIKLVFRTTEGLESQAPILAARSVDVEEGQMLILWLRFSGDEVDFELGVDDDLGQDLDDEDDSPGLI
jgi:hypothetical protein